MKTFRFPIDAYQAEWMFAPLRSKQKVIELLIKTVKIMLAPTTVEKIDQSGSVTLAVSKMNRLIYVSQKKIFSIAFPFFVQERDGRLQFRSHSHPQIDNKATSDVLALMAIPRLFESADVLDFADPVCAACDFDTNIWNLLRDLLLYEDGYVRYDDDAINKDGHRHPQFHLDLFYSHGATFKTGLRSAISGSQLLDILDVETDCHYLSRAGRS